MRRLLIVFLLTGCTNLSGDRYMTSEQAGKIKDVRYCQSYGKTNGGSASGDIAGAVDYAARVQAAFDACMADRGYVPIPANPGFPSQGPELAE